MAIALHSGSKILLIRLSSLGDVVLCSPVIRTIKLQKDCEIHFLTKPIYKDLINENPYISKCIYYIDDISLKEQLQIEEYELVIDLHYNVRTARIKRWLDCPSIEFHKANIEKWLMVSLKIDRLPHMHLVDRYFAALSSIDVVNDDEGLEVHFTKAKPILEHSDNYVVIAFGTAHFTKTMPISLVNNILEKLDYKIILIGGEEHMDSSKELKISREIINMIGKTSLRESIQIIQESVVVLAGDTGMMHIAAALKKPTVSVWGSTIPAFGMTPYYGKYDIPHHIIEQKELVCRPCSKIGKPSCPKGHFDCMRKISAEVVVSKINAILERN